MAMQLSIEGGKGQGRRDGGSAAAWIFGRLAEAVGRCGQAGREALARLRSAQGQTGKRKQMKLVESLALGNRRQLLLVVCGGQKYLVGAGADSVGSILAIEPEEALRDRAARGPELVRRRGRDAAHEARSKVVPQAGLDLWH